MDLCNSLLQRRKSPLQRNLLNQINRYRSIIQVKLKAQVLITLYLTLEVRLILIIQNFMRIKFCSKAMVLMGNHLRWAELMSLNYLTRHKWDHTKICPSTLKWWPQQQTFQLNTIHMEIHTAQMVKEQTNQEKVFKILFELKIDSILKSTTTLSIQQFSKTISPNISKRITLMRIFMNLKKKNQNKILMILKKHLKQHQNFPNTKWMKKWKVFISTKNSILLDHL